VPGPRPRRRRPRQDHAGVEILRRSGHGAAVVDLHADHFRANTRRSPGTSATIPQTAISSCDRISRPCAGALGPRSHRPGHPRRPFPRRPGGGDRPPAGSEAGDRPLPGRGVEAGGGPGDRVLPRQAQHRSRLPPRAADRPVGPARGRAPLLFDLGGQRVRRGLRGHLRLRRGPAAGGRHPHPRGGRRPDGDQSAPRRSAACSPTRSSCSSGRSARRPWLHDIYATFMAKPIAHEPGSAMHIHQSVLSAKTGRQHLHRRPGQADGGLLPLHRRPAALRAGGYLHAGALRQFLSAAGQERLGAGQRAVGLRQPHHRPSGPALLARQPPGGEPRSLLGRQPLPRHRRVAGLRLAGPDRAA
jgi:hypothetical protein